MLAKWKPVYFYVFGSAIAIAGIAIFQEGSGVLPILFVITALSISLFGVYRHFND